MQENQRSNEIVKLLKWIENNHNIWLEICQEEGLPAGRCRELIEEMEQEGFWLLIPVIVERNMPNIEVDRAMTRFVYRKIRKAWEEKRDEEIVDEIKEALKGVKK